MSEASTRVSTGGCLCGVVRFLISGPLRDVVNYHCTMCQKLHGAVGAHSKARKADIKITEERGLKWYRTSETARRGFCRECGSRLFWQPDEQDATGIVAGCLDQPTDLRTMGHISSVKKPTSTRSAIPCRSLINRRTAR